MKVSVVFTTYNSPKWLEKVLIEFFNQTYQDFEIVIADDGSKESTAQLINEMKLNSPVPIQHIWHEDNGFQKCKIMNKAVLAAQGDYLDRKSTRLNSSHVRISYAVFCLKKKI